MNTLTTKTEFKKLNNGKEVIEISEKNSIKSIDINMINMILMEEGRESTSVLIFVDGVFSCGAYRPQAVSFERSDDAYQFVSMVSNKSKENLLSCFNDSYQRVSVKPSAISMVETKENVLILGVVGSIVQRFEFDCAQSAVDFKESVFN